MSGSTLLRRPFQRILLIKPSAVGDVIHTLPVLGKLRARYPAARIDWLLAPHIAELVRHHPAVSNIVLFPRHELARFGRNWSATASLLSLLRSIWTTRYDLVIDLHGQLRTALFTLASHASVRIGFDRPRKAVRKHNPRGLTPKAYLHGWTGTREGAWLTYTHRIPIPTLEIHAVDRYLGLGPLLGLDPGPPRFHLPIPALAHQRVRDALHAAGILGRPYAVLVPGTQWETKHWPAESFAEIGRYWSRRHGAVVLAGSEKESRRCERVAQDCPGAVTLCGRTTLSELAALLQGATLSITNDSGAMHLAAALGRRVVSIFGPTDEVWIGPYGQPEHVARAHLPCTPCYLRKLRFCPHDHLCMKSVTPAMVIRKMEQALARDVQVCA